MARLEWDKTGEKFFEAGVDHGVLYPNGGPGVPWNGLISIEEQVSGGETEAYYFDGIKYFDSVANEDFQANLQAFTYPDEFAACEGTVSIVPGFSAEYQTRQTFGLSWRTRVGNDIDGIEHSSKIHIVYGATAAPSNKTYQTLGDSPVPVQFEWTINAVPTIPGQGLGDSGGDPDVDFLNWMWPPGPGMVGWPKGPDGNTFVDGWWATPYVVIDEQDVTPDVYDSIVDSLNGTPETLPYLPSLPDLINIINGNLDLVPPAPLDPNYVPPDPGDGNGGGGTGGGYPSGSESLPIVYVETYKDALDENPGKSLLPYGPAYLLDGNEATHLDLSSLHAADYFIYFDTSKLNPNAQEFSINFTTNWDDVSGGNDYAEIRVELYDAVATFDSVNGAGNQPPNSGNNYQLGAFDVVLEPNRSSNSFVVNQEWLNSVDQSSGAWVPGKVFGTPVNFAALMSKIKSKPYALLQFRINHSPNASQTPIQIVEASITQSLVAHTAIGISMGSPITLTESKNNEWAKPQMLFGGTDPLAILTDGSDDTFIRASYYRDSALNNAGQGVSSTKNYFTVPLRANGDIRHLNGMQIIIRMRVNNDFGESLGALYLDMHGPNWDVEYDVDQEYPVGEWLDVAVRIYKDNINNWSGDSSSYQQMWNAMLSGTVQIDFFERGGAAPAPYHRWIDYAKIEIRPAP